MSETKKSEMRMDAARVVEARMDGTRAEGVRAGGRAAELDELAEALIRAEGRILSETHEEEGTRIRAQLPQSAMHKLKRILGGNDGSDAEKTE